MLEMTSDAPTNAGKHVMSNITFVRYTKDSVFWLAQMTLRIMTFRNFPPCAETNIISDGPTNRSSIRQLTLRRHEKIIKHTCRRDISSSVTGVSSGDGDWSSGFTCFFFLFRSFRTAATQIKALKGLIIEHS